MEVRLQKVLAQAGIASRRKAETLITAGRVLVNGKVATLGDRVDPAKARITLDGNPVAAPRTAATEGRRSHLYLLMHKPTDVLCSCQDDRGRRTVLDLLPEDLAIGTGLHPVGRLDRNSSGALILTNDGDLTYQLTHPRHHLPKTYRVWVEGLPDEDTLDRWRAGGLVVEGRPVAPAPVTLCRIERDRVELEIVLREGRNRQIRRIGELLGHPVLKLHRTAIGSIDLRRRGRHGALQRGQYRPLTHQEVSSLHRQIGLISSKHFNPHPQHE
ncbi:MAG: rRNA pseudouridine synthase [Cyanobacteria bacterium]|nr:rRNA pseudouridine synthase [Cyanobacteriota bacterium]